MQAEDDVHVLSGALKLFFRELQEPVFPSSYMKEFFSAIRALLSYRRTFVGSIVLSMGQSCSGIAKERHRLNTMKDLLQKLPQCHYDTLRHLIYHLNKSILASIIDFHVPSF